MDKPANAVNGAPAAQALSPHPTLARESSAASIRRQDLAASSTSTATSASASPFASRESSPARPSARAAAAAAHGTLKGPAAAAAASASASATPTIRSRRNSSQHETSPSRSRAGIPTFTGTAASAAQKTGSLSATSIPTLLPAAAAAADGASSAVAARTPGPQKAEQPPRDSSSSNISSNNNNNTNGPRWPVSPRLRSPPPVLNRLPLAPSPAPSPSLDAAPAPPSDSEAEDLYLLQPPGMRTPVRGASGNVPTLETVQEASPLSPSRVRATAAHDKDKLETASVASVSDADVGTATTPEVAEVSSIRTIRARQIAASTQASHTNDSGSETGSTKASRRTAPAGGSSSGAAAAVLPLPPPPTSRSSSTFKGTGSKGKAGEGSQPTMTVETETVTSIPTVALGPSAAQSANGSLRTKPSSETIRPKKEKKKAARKQAAVTPGTATSKADIFEAKVASAVDEANTSDSEETFVYDSNPADSRDRPHRFHHSRTPSATSLANNDRNGMRSIHSILEGAGPSSGGVVKKNMKFVNATFGNSSGNDSGLAGDDEPGKTATIRGGVLQGSGRGTARLHHHVGAGAGGSHIGRWGLSGPKNGGGGGSAGGGGGGYSSNGGSNGHQSILDTESSPFPVNALSSPSSRRGGGGATSLRASGSRGGTGGPPYSQKRGYGAAPYGYDMDDTTPGAADDERTPLVAGSLRSSGGGGGGGRSNRTLRRHHSVSLRALEQQPYHHHRHPTASFLNRFASCLVLAVMLMLVVTGAIGFMFATSQPLEDIELVKISGVLASEQELMFDLMVRAHNPNVVVVTVDSADMEVFAKSPHAGTDSEWWRRPRPPKDGEVSTSAAAVDVDADALDNEPRDQPDSSPNFLLGKFTTFDNPLSFEGSFFHHGLSTSRSGVRIRRPGNGTDGGSERWERILDDEFDLIIKGVLRYSLPLSQRVRSALIEGRTTVKPNAADGPKNGTTSVPLR